MRRTAVGLLLLSLAPPLTSVSSAQYAARREGDVVRLEDTKHQTVVSIIPSIGNQAFEM